MARVIAFVRDPILNVRVRAALDDLERAGYPRDVGVLVDDWSELAGELRRALDALVVCDLCETDPLDAHELAEFAAAHPHTELVAYARLANIPGTRVVAAMRAGVREIIDFDVHDTDASGLRERLQARLAAPLHVQLLAAASIPVSARLATLITWLCDQKPGDVTPLLLARRYAAHPATLRRHLQRAGLPPPEELIGWVRLLHAARRLMVHPRVERTAFALGYGSGAALTNHLKRYAGVTPSTLIALGGIAYLLERFRSRCKRQSEFCRAGEQGAGPATGSSATERRVRRALLEEL